MSMINADENFEKLGLTLPPAPAPAGVYKPCVIDGKYLYLSGHGPVRNDKSLIIGRIGKDLTMDEGKLAAQQVGLTMLATIKANLGSFNKIKRVIKVLGMVNCTPDFGKHPYVINGCSELFAAALRKNQLNPADRVRNTDIQVDPNEVVMISKDTLTSMMKDV